LEACCSKEIEEKEGASFSLQNAPLPHLLVDFDRPGSPLGRGKIRCDFLFVADGAVGKPGYVVPIEMTSGRNKAASKVKKQILAGANFAEQTIPKSMKAQCYPVLVGKLRKKQYRQQLRRKENQVRFHDQVATIQLVANGERLAKALPRDET